MDNPLQPENSIKSPHAKKHYDLGMQELEKGRWKAAEKAFRQALSFERGNKVIEKAIAEAMNQAPKHSFVIKAD